MAQVKFLKYENDYFKEMDRINDEITIKSITVVDTLTDNIGVSGYILTDLIPSTSKNLGSSGYIWNNAFINNFIDTSNNVISADDLYTITAGPGSNADNLHTHSASDAQDVKVIFTASGSIMEGSPVIISEIQDDTVSLADSNSIEKSHVIGISAQSISDGVTGYITISGFSTIPSTQIEEIKFNKRGRPVYISMNGKLTQNIPVGNGNVIYQVGIATGEYNMVIELKSPIVISN